MAEMHVGDWAPTPVEVHWEGERRFRGGPAAGPSLLLDGHRQQGPTPVEAVLVALAACTGIDVVEILAKGRTPATALRIEVAYARAPEPPRRLVAARLRFYLRGTASRAAAERAIELSMAKYCSVRHSLAPEVEIRWELVLDSTPDAVSQADGSAA